MKTHSEITAPRALGATPEVQARTQNSESPRRTRVAPLTNSSVGAYMACPRRYWWSYELGVRREKDGRALTIGKIYHAALEAINTGIAPEAAAVLARHPDLEEVDREIAACMVAGWSWRWSEAPAFRRVLAAEKVFEFRPIKSKRFTVAGKIDVIGEMTDGTIAVGEYKTTVDDVSPGSDYWRRLLIDRQISGYVLGARALGFPADRVLYDAARLPGIRPRLLSRKGGSDGARESMDQFSVRLMESIAEKPEFYFGRQEIPRLDSDLEEWRSDMAQAANMIGQSRKAGRWPRNTDSCMRWGKCPYFDPCAASHNPETAGLPSGFRRVENVNVELTIDGASENAEQNGSEAASA